ncbi:MAG TPA: glucoamylase, partial [Candidatus Thermoplasmatota archaeon]|nr:glucoamylase [Candidatus Thermoplasmatota archaeon]
LGEAAAERAADRVEKELWDPDVGLLQRYLPFREDAAVHLHAGNGPWLAYSAWLAQRHAAKGRRDRAERIVAQILQFATPEGWLPEHVSTRERFLDFMQHEWETGLDFRKEFDPEILLPGVTFTEILDEANKMHAAYRRSALDAERAGDGIIRFATPLAWTHAEVAVALGLLGDKARARPETEARAEAR